MQGEPKSILFNVTSRQFSGQFGRHTSEEHCERFHQELKTLEQGYQGRWGINMMPEYCWWIIREGEVTHKRKGIRRSFTGKRQIIPPLGEFQTSYCVYCIVYIVSVLSLEAALLSISSYFCFL